MFHNDDPLILVSLILQVGILHLLLKGALRKYPLVLAYSLTRLVTSVLEVIVRQQHGKQTAYFRQVYYSDRVILNLLLFIMVAAIIHSLVAAPLRSIVDKALAGTFASVLFLPFLALSRPFTVHWLNGMSQFLYFGSGVITLVLWTVLITSRPRNEQLLKFTAGLGVAMTGAAIGFGFHQWLRTSHFMWMPNLFLQVTHIAGLLIWLWALRPAKRQVSDLPTHSEYTA